MRAVQTNLFEFGWLSEYLSLSRAAIVVASILIVLHCHRMATSGGGESPPACGRIAALFGTATFSNAAASLASLDPNIYFGLALAALNTVVVVILFMFVVKGWEQSPARQSQNIAEDCYPDADWKNEKQGEFDP